MSHLSKPLALVKATAYTQANDRNAILPEVYGDFRDFQISDPPPAGPVKAVNIHKGQLVWAAANHQVLSIDYVFVNGVRKTSGFATSIANNYGGLGTIATITFIAAPYPAPGDTVTWAGRGKPDASNALINNPIEQLQSILLLRGGLTTANLETGTWQEAITAWNSPTQLQTAWVFSDPRTVQAWLTEILFNAMGFWRVSGNGKLAIYVDNGAATPAGAMHDTIVAHRDCVDGDEGVTMVFNRQHVVNMLSANYGAGWSGGGFLGKFTTPEDTLSKLSMGEARKEVDLSGIRFESFVTTWSNALFARQAFRTRVEGAELRFTVEGSKLLHATIGDLLPFTWRYGPARTVAGDYANRLLRLIRVEHDFVRGTTTVAGIDTGTTGGPGL